MEQAVLDFQRTVLELSVLVGNPSVTEREIDKAKERLQLGIDLLSAHALANGISGNAIDGLLGMSQRLTSEARETAKLRLLQDIADSSAQAAAGVVDA